MKNKANHLAAHMKNLHNKRKMVCPVCGKVCKNDHAMKVHTIMEHKPPKHKCNYCDKRFKTANHCRDHEATHTGIARYFCEVCGAPFKSGKRLKRFLRINKKNYLNFSWKLFSAQEKVASC